ncbi:hypothetical protein [Nocardia salmonicida]|uniref:hypothetical protein n=1 Tax=Nocardia salmonicida TaxID=53431 RepID=UPI0007A3BE8A|nr:hypothetical protein [Nocardia salmonicida]
MFSEGNLPIPRYSISSQHGPFLSPQELVAAIHGRTDCDLPLARWARTLGSLYRDWLAEPTAVRVGQQIVEVVHDIDVWITARLPRPRPGVPRGLDSVGGIIGRVAEAAACAHWALHNTRDTNQRHRAWNHLAEMREGYEDMVRLILDGSIHLPESWPSISWSAPTM